LYINLFKIKNMSNCSNCFNGCTEIVSDRCVRYTGINVPALGIQTGDTLSHVEESIVNFLVPVLTGVGVKPIIDDNIICNLVRANLPTCTVCTGFTLNELLSALIKSACDLQEEIDVINATLTTLNADYTIPVGPSPTFTPCLTGVTASSDTHAILQAVINKLCTLDTQFTQLLIDLPNTYVKISQLDILIQAYLNSTTNSLISNRMVPYAVVPYFGPISFFDSSGAGTGNWTRIFLCNGNNSTPDLRGRTLTGVINGLSGPTMNPAVDPGASSANPNYSLYDVVGANQITLGPTQIPIHTHANQITVVDQGHTHTITDAAVYTSEHSYGGTGQYFTKGTKTTNVGTANILATITNAPAPTGGGLPHPNIQPVTACYYIQYRP
jgi:microcystin-dependent protein